jgi:KDO2-lipid IV(A) lauroyltransferase
MLLANYCPLHVVVERFADERMDQLVQAQRKALGMEVLWMEKSPRQILRVLQQNGVVAIIADRPLPPGEGVPVTFFGRRCYVPGGVAQLALLSGAAIMPGWGRYDGNGSTTFYGGLEPVILPESTGDRKADTQRLTQRIYAALEAIMGPFPDQWYMFRPFWPEEPASAEATEAAGATPEIIQAETQGAGRTPRPSRVAQPDGGLNSSEGERDG